MDDWRSLRGYAASAGASEFELRADGEAPTENVVERADRRITRPRCGARDDRRLVVEEIVDRHEKLHRAAKPLDLLREGQAGVPLGRDVRVLEDSGAARIAGGRRPDILLVDPCALARSLFEEIGRLLPAQAATTADNDP